jgi:quinoprotein glucose dehydrogenase
MRGPCPSDQDILAFSPQESKQVSKTIRRREFLQNSAGAAIAAALPLSGAEAAREWRYYGGDSGATRYSAAEQINKSNVKKLTVAWTHRTGDAMQRPATAIECTPIVVDGVMYLTTAQVKVQAIDPATGKRKWEFDPMGGRGSRRSPGVNRGLTYWQQGKDKRIFAVAQDMLYSIDAVTGELDQSFGSKGALDLKQDFDHDMTGLSFKHTSPVVVFEDLVITGGGGGEGPYPEAPGHIRAWDARTGKRKWIFHTVPKPGEFGHETWEGDSWKYTGGTNCWAGMSLDTQRGIVFAGIGSPSFDFYGGNRKGDNLFGNCVLALDARTGKRVWHYQIVHHDVWDYDMPAQPALMRFRHGGREVDVVVQITKQGFVFVFDRQTGKPLYGAEERPIPVSDLEGELLSKTQPFPLKPPPVNRQGFFEKDITDLSPEAHAHVRAIWEKAKAGKLYTPVAKDGVLIHPGFRGGPLWGGCCFDPKRNLLIVPSGEWTNRIILRDATADEKFKYGLVDRQPVLDHEGYPAIKPPWSYLTAIDADKGDFRWRVVMGEFAELKARGIPKTGTPFHGGAICTAGGLVFMAGTFDKKMRAYDTDSGEVLWEHQLNEGGFATPCTYEAGGKQYVVIAAGGGKDKSKASDEYVAFALG